MKEIKCIKIIVKNKKAFLINIYKDNTIKKVLIKDKYKDDLVCLLSIIFCGL